MMLSRSFDPNEAAFIKQSGTSTIQGDAFMRQNGGTVVTCAGSQVDLIPVTAYSTERMNVIYHNTNKGFRPIHAAMVTVPNSSYADYMRHTRCDAQGNFRFSNLAAGEYYVTTGVKWLAGSDNVQGGALMAKVILKPGQTEELVLSP